MVVKPSIPNAEILNDEVPDVPFPVVCSCSFDSMVAPIPNITAATTKEIAMVPMSEIVKERCAFL